MTLQPPRGTYDALPEKAARMRFIENTAIDVFRAHGYGEIRTPVFEAMDVFARNVGESTDIVSKEMYLFEDRGGDKMALRPEGTAAVVRAYYSNGLKQNLPMKLCYAGIPVFRYERPQAGRYRQHHQVGIECFGYAGPVADVEAIAVGFSLLDALGLNDGLFVNVNTLGSAEDRKGYRQRLVEYFTPYLNDLSADSKMRLEKNPLRILDSKAPNDIEIVQNAPKMKDFLSDASRKHYEGVLEGMDALGISYRVQDTLVRGLDYYTHTVFEIHSDKLGAQSQIISGGRYDGLIAQMGGDDVPAVGFGSGIERLESLMAERLDVRRPVHFIVMSEKGLLPALKMAETVRAKGIVAYVPLDGGSFKAQMKRANKENACYCVILGDEELASGQYQVKDMDTGHQQALEPEAITAYLTRSAF